MVSQKTGLLLMAFGGPESLDQVEPFMTKLMGRTPPPQIVARVIGRYKAIGGASPLPKITRRQASALENALGAEDFIAYVGMRYASPSLGDAVKAMAVDGIGKAVAISMSPHASRVSTAAYVDELRRAAAETDGSPEFLFVESWHKQPRFLDAVAAKIRSGLARFETTGADVDVIFSAHSLPKAYIDEGDPYVEQLNETVEGVLGRIGNTSWHLAFQSRGTGPGEWLKPEVDDVLAELAAAGRRNVLVVPIGFACDHIETLYDIDIAMRGKAASLGLAFERTECPNTDPEFIESLANVVRERLRIQ